MTESELALIVGLIEKRLDREASPEQKGKLLTTTFILAGLRFPWEVAVRAFKGVKGMKESTTYQGILAEGRAEGRIEGAREILLRRGRKKLGEPGHQDLPVLEAMTDFERLERMIDCLDISTTWKQVLETP